jgi:Zn-dependent M28 family amino/carboxypeptidase
VLAALAAAATLALSPGGDAAHELAVRIARAGPRPAASRAERAAHGLVRDRFQAAGLNVAIQRFAVPGKGRSRNVIGVFDTPNRCLRIVMAHTDSVPDGPGANDNASGVGVISALAPRLRRLEVACDVWLVATGSEERVYTGSPDHLGALALARRVRRRGLADQLAFALSLDEVGRDRPFWLRAPVATPRRGAERALLAAARRAGARVRFVPDEGTGNSDHREFNLLGMPAAKLGVGAGGEPCRHMACDRPRRLRKRSLATALRIAARAVEVPRR